MIFDCAAVVTVPAVVALVAAVALPALVAYVAFATVPVTLAPVIAVKLAPLPETLVNTPFVAPILPTLAFPETLSPVNVPVDVMFGCAAFVTVCATDDVDTIPVN